MTILGASDRIVIGIGTRQKGKGKDKGMGVVTASGVPPTKGEMMWKQK